MGSEQRNALFAVVLSGLILFGWQYFFAPPANKAEIVPIGPQTKVESGSIEPAASTAPVEPVQQASYSLSMGDTNTQFNSSLAITEIESSQAALPFEEVVGSASPFRIEFDFGQGFKSLSFSKSEGDKYINAENDLTLISSIDDQGASKFSLVSTRDFNYRLVFTAQHLKLENQQERKFVLYTDELNSYEIADDEDSGDRAIKWAGIDFNYHLFAIYFDKEPTLLYKVNASNEMVLKSAKPSKTLEYSAIFVKKDYNELSALGHNLKNAVDFGIWGFFAVWILKGLQFFHTLVPNWGVAIILLTFVIRLITFPLQYKSFVSMKKLQLVQPELTKIREKFKDDPQRLQKESMDLFRKSGANPLGGCLPLILQMPVFFAFYKVLYGAVELVDAPFIFWIKDLSNKDPYFVLPVLMTGAMFLQQKLTPNTVSDPTQKKVMMFMPLIFGFIMKDLPSGLSLYIFVSTIMGIAQQLIVFNSKGKALSA